MDPFHIIVRIVENEVTFLHNNGGWVTDIESACQWVHKSNAQEHIDENPKFGPNVGIFTCRENTLFAPVGSW